jgi:hypothetical protein
LNLRLTEGELQLLFRTECVSEPTDSQGIAVQGIQKRTVTEARGLTDLNIHESSFFFDPARVVGVLPRDHAGISF